VEILLDPLAMQEMCRLARLSGMSVGFVPTMGSLHDGHLSLIRAARADNDLVAVSIFVNPTQFAPGEDFEAYPRNEAGDAELLASAGCALLYAPAPDQIYPPGFSTTVKVWNVSEPLEGERRPTHFAGVATVVAKLLIQAQPDLAVFGEKDYQQLRVIQRMALDLSFGTEVVGRPIVRESDGLALSSRNASLSPEERAAAPGLYRALRGVADAVNAGAPAPDAIARARAAAS